MQTVDDFFAINEDAARRLVRLKLRGFWTIKVFEQYRIQVLRALQRLKMTPPEHEPINMWVDLKDCPVQSPDIIARLSALETEMRPLVGKMAVLTASQLKAVQARRVGNGDGYKVSLDEDELAAWLAV